MRPQFRLRTLLLAVTVVALVLSSASTLIYIVAGPAVPPRLLRQVVPGMTKTEVGDLLGEPQHRGGEHQWEYWRWGNAGWVEVHFNRVGTVHSVNDESVFP